MDVWHLTNDTGAMELRSQSKNSDLYSHMLARCTVPLGLALVVAFAATLSALTGPKRCDTIGERPVQDHAVTGSLTVTPAILDLKEVHPGVIMIGCYTVLNESTEDVRIAEVVTSCSCTAAAVDDPVLKPGESRNLDIRTEVTARVGRRINELIFITFEDPTRPPVEVQLTYKTVDLVRTAPDQFRTDLPDHTCIVITSIDQVSFAITDIEPAVVTAEFDQERSEHELKLDVEAWREAGQPSTIAVATTHPGVNIIKIRAR